MKWLTILLSVTNFPSVESCNWVASFDWIFKKRILFLPKHAFLIRQLNFLWAFVICVCWVEQRSTLISFWRNEYDQSSDENLCCFFELHKQTPSRNDLDWNRFQYRLWVCKPQDPADSAVCYNPLLFVSIGRSYPYRQCTQELVMLVTRYGLVWKNILAFGNENFLISLIKFVNESKNFRPNQIIILFLVCLIFYICFFFLNRVIIDV